MLNDTARACSSISPCVLWALPPDVRCQVFDVLASVPWLDETNVQQKELKGVAMIGLLGTLEEVGFNIRAQVQRIWAGKPQLPAKVGCRFVCRCCHLSDSLHSAHQSKGRFVE